MIQGLLRIFQPYFEMAEPTLPTPEDRPIEADFVGLPELIETQAGQLALFEQWANNKDYWQFSINHYDWWMFPIDRTSRGQQGKYTIYAREIKTLQDNPIFMKNYRRGVALLLQSWGWDVYGRFSIRHPESNQRFDGHCVRLLKVLQSLALFEELDLFESVGEFARRNVKESLLEKEGILPFLRARVPQRPIA